jgi:uncharacterized protein (DUF952 family)
VAGGDEIDPEAFIHHLAERDAWEEAVVAGEYRVSTLGMALDEVGFIHCSRPHQVAPVAQRFYGGVDDLVLLTIDPELLFDVELRYEPGTGTTDELFPHVYGPLPVYAVIQVVPYAPTADGTFPDVTP